MTCLVINHKSPSYDAKLEQKKRETKMIEERLMNRERTNRKKRKKGKPDWIEPGLTY